MFDDSLWGQPEVNPFRDVTGGHSSVTGTSTFAPIVPKLPPLSAPSVAALPGASKSAQAGIAAEQARQRQVLVLGAAGLAVALLLLRKR